MSTDSRTSTPTDDDAPRAGDDQQAAAVPPSMPADRRDAVAGVGAQLRERRQAAGLSLRQFAKSLGVSASFISQIENGKSQPSVATLYLICNTLDITVDELFAASSGSANGSPANGVPAVSANPAAGADLRAARPPAGPGAQPNAHGNALAGLNSVRAASEGPVVTPDQRRRLVLDTGVTWEQLSSTHERAVDFMFVTYDVGGGSTAGEMLTRHAGVEYGYIISGELEVSLRFDTFTLGPGDAISFDSSMPHRFHNAGQVPVQAIWFVHGRETDHEH